MQLSDIISQLKQPFDAADHKDRDLPGGGKWFYIPWQKIRDRLDEVYPGWEMEWGQPQYIDKYCMVSCTLTIAGVKRQEIGNAQIEILSSKGNDMSRGTPIERAKADAFKNAAEAFGVGAYLDDQKFVTKWLQQQRDGRGAAYTRPERRDDNIKPVAGRNQTSPSAPAKIAQVLNTPPDRQELTNELNAIAPIVGGHGAIRRRYEFEKTIELTTHRLADIVAELKSEVLKEKQRA